MSHNTIIIFGTGAVGGYYGAYLSKDEENNVTFVARGNHLKAIQNNGLKIISRGIKTVYPVQAVGSLNEYDGTADYIFVTVKSYDTETAIEQFKHCVGENTQIITIQNGIDNYDRLTERFGSDKVIRGYCAIAAEITAPGEITHTAYGTIVIGEDNGAVTERIKKLESVLSGAGIPVKIAINILHDVWKKFAWNSIFNIITAITGKTVKSVYAHPETLDLCRKIFDEVRSVARYANVELTDQDMEWILTVSSDTPDFRPSTLQDRLNNKPLEYESFTGFIIRRAANLNIDVPVHKTLYALLKVIDS
ncbi:MAG: ketopantoate reductase family protein [Candidatus Auribacter fodinae]|jgi:2-dehydropantoate 2-reductase|uniref:2-dehydropantoate 2-reductase n=1 Tax=Candidatus Auribacter fodinae TaxID=2093366 RepID=A0A3A4QX56_9BACT|nr:MAG: ketopantoate reductase family protein [Candidatus Auribacter fodinae]